LPLYELYKDADFIQVYTSLLGFPVINIKFEDSENSQNRIAKFDTGIGGKFFVEYKAIDVPELEEMVQENTLDLKGRFLHNFDILDLFEDDPWESENLIVNNFDARLSFWEGGMNFLQTHFTTTVLFDFAYIEGAEVSFNGSQFEDCSEISFNETSFNNVQRIVFSSTHFNSSNLNFTNANFNSTQLYFNSINAHNTDILFKNIDFSRVASTFSRTTIDKSIVFDNIIFSTIAEMEFSSVESIMFDNCTINGKIKLDGIQHTLSFMNSRGDGQIYLDWCSNNVKLKIANAYKVINIKKDRLNAIAADYLYLKNNYKRINDDKDEDLAHFEYSKVKTKLMRLGLKKSFNILMSLVCGYGTSIYRALYAIILTILVFGTIFSLKILNLNYTFDLSCFFNTPWKNVFSYILNSFYFSLTSFFSLTHYSSINSDLQLIKTLSTIEGIFGIILIAIFTVVLTRNLLRNYKD